MSSFSGASSPATARGRRSPAARRAAVRAAAAPSIGAPGPRPPRRGGGQRVLGVLDRQRNVSAMSARAVGSSSTPTAQLARHGAQREQPLLGPLQAIGLEIEGAGRRVDGGDGLGGLDQGPVDGLAGRGQPRGAAAPSARRRPAAPARAPARAPEAPGPGRAVRPSPARSASRAAAMSAERLLGRAQQRALLGEHRLLARARRPAGRARPGGAVSSLGLRGRRARRLGKRVRRRSRAARQPLQAARRRPTSPRSRRRRRAAPGGCARRAGRPSHAGRAPRSAGAQIAQHADAGRLVVDEGAGAAIGAERRRSTRSSSGAAAEALFLQ